MRKYIVTLTTEERDWLRTLIRAGKGSALKLARARVLLKADPPPDGPDWPDQRIAEAVEVGLATVSRVRRRFVELGVAAALERRKPARPSPGRRLDGRAEAKLIALACSAPPEGRTVWTMQLLAGRLVELRVVDSVSDETVR